MGATGEQPSDDVDLGRDDLERLAFGDLPVSADGLSVAERGVSVAAVADRGRW